MRRLLAVFLSFSLVFQNLVVVLPVAAQVTASPTAPSGQRPLVDGTANGVPLVNIAPPSAGGVSHNQYNQFNVDQRGLILNNSMRPTDTTLSGWVNGNPQLGSTPARVILNEVVGGDPSQLRGYLEIAGQRAELVVANPNGIHCDGCGFLNASRVMLGTGTPQMNGGNLDRLTPGTGSLSVGTKGLDARTVEQLDLLSREIVVEGDVLAQDLAVIASSNQVLYGTLRILDGTGDPNTSGQKFALDVKALGGMYANQIHMIATDKGLGVNSAGTLATKQGNLEISANGDIRIHDTFSQQDMILDGPGDVRLTGRTQAEGRLSLETKGQLINEGELQAGTSDITVTGDFVNSGQINSTENLTLSSGGSLVNRGKDAVLQAGETLFLTAGQDIHNEGAVKGAQTVTVTAGQDIRNDGIVNGGQTVTVTAGRDIRSDGTVSSDQAVTVTAQTGTLTNHGTVSGVTLDASAAGDVTNSGAIAAADRLRLHSGGTFSNTESSQDGAVATLQSGRDLSLTVDGDLDNKGVISGQTTAVTVGGQMTNSGVVTGTDALSLTIGQSLTNQEVAGTSLSRKATAEGKTTVPTLQSDGIFWLKTGEALTNAGTLTAQEVAITSGGAVVNEAAGTINANQTLTLDSGQSLTNQGLIASDQDLQVTVAADTINSGTLLAANDLSLRGGGTLQNQESGVIHADRALSVAVQGQLTNKGTISAVDAALSTQNNLVNSGLVTGTDRLEVNTAGSLNNTKDGLIRSEDTLILNAGDSVTNQGTISGKDSTITVAKGLNNDVTGLIDGLIANVKADTVRNTGRIYGDDLTLVARQATNRDGGVIAARDTLAVGADTLDNLEKGLITSLGDATFYGLASPTTAMTRLTNGSSRIEAGGHLSIFAALLENRNDHLETYLVVDAPIYHEDILMGGLAHPSYTCSNLGNTSAASCPGSASEDYTIRTYLTTYSHTEVSRSEPGEILAGRNLVLRGNVRNTDSHIVAGDALRVSGGTIENIATKGTNTLTVSSGSETFTEVVYGGTLGNKKKREYSYRGGYAPAPVITYSDLHTPRYENNASDPGLGAAPSPGSFSVAGRDVLLALGQQLQATLDGLVAITGKDANFQVITRPVKIVLPDSRLFTLKTDPASPYLIETDPTFTSYRSFLSSDYLYNQLKFDPDRTMKHLGDGFYEQRLVQDQIRALTGQDFLGDHRNQEEQYRALMNAGAKFAAEFDLTPGVRLTADQMAALTEDMVWLVAEEVTLPDGRVETVLVPQVYVHQTRTTLMVADNGSLMVGRTVALEATDSIINSGRIAGQDVALKAGTDIVVARGTVSGDTTRLEAGRDLSVQSGHLDGRETLDLSAGRDVLLTTETVRSTNSNHSGNTRDTLGETTTVRGGDITVQAGRNLSVAGADVSASKDLSLTAGQDVSVTTVADSSHEAAGAGGSHRIEDRTSHQGSSLSAGGNLTVTASNTLGITGSTLTSGQDTTLSGSDVTIAAAVDRSSRDEAIVNDHGQRTYTEQRESTVGGTVTAGGNLSVVATDKDVTLHGAQLTAAGDATLAAARDVTISALVTENTSHYTSNTTAPGVKKSDSSDTTSQTVNGSLVMGNNVTVTAGADSDVRVRGSTILALNDITVDGKNIYLEAEQEKNHHDEYHYKKAAYALFETKKNSLEMGFGVASQEQKLKQNSTVNVASMLMAGNNLTARAQNDIVGEAAQLYAGQDVSLLAGRDVLLEAATDHSDMSFEQRIKDIGIKLTLTKNITQTLQDVGNFPEKVTVGEGGGLAEVVSGVTAAFEFIGLVKGILAPTIASANLKIGASSQYSSMSSSQDRPRTGTVAAGNDLIIQGGRDVLLEGTNVSAGQDATLNAGRDLNIVAAEGHSQSAKDSHSTTAGISVGLGLGLTGLGGDLTGKLNYEQSKASGSGTTYSNARITTGGNLNTTSGQDTTLAGAGVTVGGDIAMDVGRNLTVESQQNTAKQDSQSWGGGLSLSTGWIGGNELASSFPLNPGWSLSLGSGSQDKQFTDDQTRLTAKGDVTVRTEKHTQLTGAVIASTDGNVTLDTGSFDYKDLQDHKNSENVKVGIDGSIPAIGGGDKDGKTDGKTNSGDGNSKEGDSPQTGEKSPDTNSQTSIPSPSFDEFSNDIGEFVAGSSLGLPKVDYNSTTTEGTSRATIAAPNGQVNITVRDNPTMDLSGLNRDLNQAQTIDVDHTVKTTVAWDKGMTFGLLGMVVAAAQEAQSGQKDSTAFDAYPKYFEGLIEKWGKASGQVGDVADFFEKKGQPNPPLNGVNSNQKGASQ